MGFPHPCWFTPGWLLISMIPHKIIQSKKHEILPKLHPPIQPHHIAVEFAPVRPSRWHGAWRFHGRLHGGVMDISLDLMVGGWDSMGVDWCLMGV